MPSSMECKDDIIAVPPAPARQGWLAAVLPADARKFRVDDARLAATLAAAGAEIVETGADVDVVEAKTRVSDAPVTILRIERRSPSSPLRSIRALQRAWTSSKLRARFPAARLWDEGLPLPAPLRCLPLSALVVRGDVHPTVLESAAAAARTRLRGRPIVRQGLVVADAEEGVLRVAIGPGKVQINNAMASLDALRAAGPPPLVEGCIPWIVRHGTTGLGRWSLERRVPGRTTGPLAANRCLDFLAELFSVGSGPPVEPPQVPGAEALAGRVAARTRELTRGFGHGDFWHGNLLVEGDRLTGVVDWDAAGPGRLPLVDYLHLVANAEHARRRHASLGETVVSFLLPWARNGGDEAARRLFSRTAGGELESSTLETLVAAYWLDYVAYQLRLYADRSEPTWREPNVNSVLEAFA